MSDAAPRSRGLWAFAIATGATAVLLGLAWMAAPQILASVLVAGLASAGAQDAELSVSRLGWRGAEIIDLRFSGPGAVSVESVVLDYTPSGLLQRRVDRVAISGALLRVALGDSSQETPDSEPALRGSSGVRLPLLRVDEFDLERVAIELTDANAQSVARFDLGGHLDGTGAGGGSLRLSGAALRERPVELGRLRLSAAELSASADFVFEGGELVLRLSECARIAASALSLGDELRVTSPVEFCLAKGGELALDPGRGSVRAQLSIEPVSLSLLRTPADEPPSEIDLTLPKLRVAARRASPDQALTGELTASGISLSLERPGIDITGLEVKADWTWEDGLRAVAPFRASALQHEDLETPLAVEGTARLVQGGALTFESVLVDPAGAVRLVFEGEHSLVSGRGRGNVNLEPISFDAAGLQPSALSAIASGLSEVSGEAQLSGPIEWGRSGLEGPVTLVLRSLSFSVGQLRVSSVQGEVQLAQLIPIASAPAQRVEVARMGFGSEGVALRQGVIEFWMRSPQSLVLDTFEWVLAGGRLWTQGALERGGESQQLEVHVENLDLRKLLREAAIAGVSGTGLLSGAVPVEFREGRVLLRSGSLESSAPGGVIRYLPQGIAHDWSKIELGELGSLDLVRALLENFHYEKLAVGVDGDLNGEVVLAVSLEGSNPDVFDGYPIRYNLNLSGRLADLAGGFSLGDQLGEQASRAVEELLRGPKPSEPVEPAGEPVNSETSKDVQGGDLREPGGFGK